MRGEGDANKRGRLRGRGEGVVSRVVHLTVDWSVREFVGTRSRKGRVAPYYMPIPGVRPWRDLDCRGILRCNARSYRVVAQFCLANRSRRKSGTIWRLQWVEGQSESGHGKRYPRLIGMSGPRCRHSDPWCKHSYPCRHSNPC